MDSADAVLAYDLAELRLRLNRTADGLSVRLPNGLWKEIPGNARGMEILLFLARKAAEPGPKTTGTAAAPLQSILDIWAQDGLDARKVSKINEDGSLNIEEIDI